MHHITSFWPVVLFIGLLYLFLALPLWNQEMRFLSFLPFIQTKIHKLWIGFWIWSSSSTIVSLKYKTTQRLIVEWYLLDCSHSSVGKHSIIYKHHLKHFYLYCCTLASEQYNTINRLCISIFCSVRLTSGEPMPTVNCLLVSEVFKIGLCLKESSKFFSHVSYHKLL